MWPSFDVSFGASVGKHGRLPGRRHTSHESWLPDGTGNHRPKKDAAQKVPKKQVVIMVVEISGAFRSQGRQVLILNS